jgi:hypothetical protein
MTTATSDLPGGHQSWQDHAIRTGADVDRRTGHRTDPADRKAVVNAPVRIIHNTIAAIRRRRDRMRSVGPIGPSAGTCDISELLPCLQPMSGSTNVQARRDGALEGEPARNRRIYRSNLCSYGVAARNFIRRNPWSFHSQRVDPTWGLMSQSAQTCVLFGFFSGWLERYMSYCGECGRELPASAAFCGRCGAPVRPPVKGGASPPTGRVASSPPTPSAPPPAPHTPPSDATQAMESRLTPQPSAPSQSAKKPFIQKPAVLIAVAIVLCVAGGLLYVALTGSSSSSAQSVASTVVADLEQGNFSQMCVLATPAEQVKCNSALSQLSVQHVTYKNLALGTVTVNGDEALLEMTGSVCDGSGQCTSNSDPNVAMSAGQTFEQAYAQAVSTSSPTPFSIPLVKQNGKWYITGF